jgi:hypothetical protein
VSLALATRGLYSSNITVSSTTPTLTDPSPATGGDLAATRALARYTPVAFTITNYATPHSIRIKFANDEQPRLAWDSAEGIQPLFDTPASSWDGAGRLTLLQRGGWQDDIEWIQVGGIADDPSWGWTLPAT